MGSVKSAASPGVALQSIVVRVLHALGRAVGNRRYQCIEVVLTGTLTWTRLNQSSAAAENANIPNVRDLVGNSPRFFAVALLAGLSLRLGFFFAYPRVSDDSRIYADIARNWLHHGIYGLSASGSILPTYIRLPGYPAFLAAVFALFGDNNFRAVFLLQIAFDLGTCWLIADIAWRLAGSRAAQAAFVFAALCPFLADYAAAALTETVEILFTALALDLGVVALQTLSERRFYPWIGCGLAIAGA
ncbi:MAG: glycosyltransferase family 39 protein, partial [Acidobacteria bacterium]|nr:glycosyltransferase family 39 protein [Acidobacteriota bacterium]